MNLKINRPHETHVYLEIGRYSSAGYHASVIEGVVIAFLDIVRMRIHGASLPSRGGRKH